VIEAANQIKTDKNGTADQLEIIYFTDPLCCWSWGFEPQWRRLLLQYGNKIRWRYCMGGLLPSWKNFIDPLNSVNRPVQMGPVWMEASHITGMPIESSIWIQDPPQSSYPACIAVKAAGLQSFFAEETYLRKLREAIMIHKQNIAGLSVLLNIAADIAAMLPASFDYQQFSNDIHSEEALEAFRKDIAEVGSKHINRFPTLLFRMPGKPSLIMTGYRPFKAVSTILDELGIQPQETGSGDMSSFYGNYGFMTDREKKEIYENTNKE
jgi:putative protein-disulfide isomerase